MTVPYEFFLFFSLSFSPFLIMSRNKVHAPMEFSSSVMGAASKVPFFDPAVWTAFLTDEDYRLPPFSFPVSKTQTVVLSQAIKNSGFLPSPP